MQTNHKVTIEVTFKEPIGRQEAVEKVKDILLKSIKAEEKTVEKTKESLKILSATAIPSPADIDWDRACELKSQGKKNREIAEALDCSEYTISNKILNEMAKRGHKVKDNKEKKTVDWDKACQMRLEGKTNRQIADALQVPLGTISNKIGSEMIKRDMALKNKVIAEKIDWDKACALKKAGWKNEDIADEIKASPNTVRCMLPDKYRAYLQGHRENAPLKEEEEEEEECPM